jgi:hypothetical protein
LQIMCFQPQVLEFFTQDEPLRRYTLYVINSTSYGDVATLTEQFPSRWGFPDVVHFVFHVVPVSHSLRLPPPLERHPPTLVRHPSFAVMPSWKHRRKFLLLVQPLMYISEHELYYAFLYEIHNEYIMVSSCQSVCPHCSTSWMSGACRTYGGGEK